MADSRQELRMITLTDEAKKVLHQNTVYLLDKFNTIQQERARLASSSTVAPVSSSGKKKPAEEKFKPHVKWKEVVLPRGGKDKDDAVITILDATADLTAKLNEAVARVNAPSSPVARDKKEKEASARALEEARAEITRLTSQLEAKAELLKKLPVEDKKGPAGASDTRQDTNARALEEANLKIARLQKDLAVAQEVASKQQPAENVTWKLLNQAYLDEKQGTIQKARALLDLNQWNLGKALSTLENNFDVYMESKEKDKISKEAGDAFKRIIGQYRLLQSKVHDLSSEPQNSNNQKCLEDYAKTLDLAKTALTTIGEQDAEKNRIAFLAHVKTLPEKHPLSRSEILVGVACVMVALLVLTPPIAVALGSVFKLSFASSAAEIIMNAVGLTEVTAQIAAVGAAIPSLIAGASLAKAASTFFGSRPSAQAHPKAHLTQMLHRGRRNTDDTAQFTTVRGMTFKA